MKVGFRIFNLLLGLSMIGCNSTGGDANNAYNDSQPTSGAENGLTPGGSQTGIANGSVTGPAAYDSGTISADSKNGGRTR